MEQSGTGTVRVIDSKVTGQALPLVRGSGTAQAVLWPGNGARYRTFNIIDLAAGDTTRDLRHAAECIYYVERGDGAIRDLEDDSTQGLREGSMIHIGMGDAYRLEAGARGMRLVGGTVPVDPAFYELGAEETAP
jgi:mannose-6-phosphate isomerase-like protein (cupin superfamily)